MIMEFSLLIFACAMACVVFIIARMLCFSAKIIYPKAYSTIEKGDFIIENLPEIEMFYTVLSPAIVGFFIYIWLSFAKEFEFYRINEINIMVTFQSVVPFV